MSNLASYRTAADLKHSIEIPQCVKLYAPGAGNADRVFLFPYKGKLSQRKVSIMAEDLAEFYPRETRMTLERAIRNTAERCAWTRVALHESDNGQQMVTMRGDGWMNMRQADAVIIFDTVHKDAAEHAS